MLFKNLFFSFVFLLGCSDTPRNTFAIQETAKNKNYSTYHSEAMEFIKSKGFSEDYYILIDLSLHSGKNRFFVYDFSEKKFTHQKLATHGSCDVFEENPEKWEKAKFSNKDGSH